MKCGFYRACSGKGWGSSFERYYWIAPGVGRWWYGCWVNLAAPVYRYSLSHLDDKRKTTTSNLRFIRFPPSFIFGVTALRRGTAGAMNRAPILRSNHDFCSSSFGSICVTLNGSRTWKRVFPGWESKRMLPWCFWMIL